MADPTPRAVVEAVMAAFQRRDLAAVLDLLAEDIEWHLPGPPEQIPFAGTRHGRPAVAEFSGIMADALEFLRLEPRGMGAEGDTVVVHGYSEVRARPTGRTAEYSWATIWRVHQGKVSSYRVYEDTAALVTAFATPAPPSAPREAPARKLRDG